MKDRYYYPGTVIEAFPGLTFDVESPRGAIVRCTIAGRMKMNNIRVLPGDKVEYVLSPDGRLGRIEKRYK